MEKLEAENARLKQPNDSPAGCLTDGGTVGQPDASGAMSGGADFLTGGLWPLDAVQTAGAPPPAITH
jgi:hypothetical protein